MALRELAPKFDSVILAGYPPFVKDVLDEASGQGINLKALHIRIIFAAESFSEKFREYVAAKIGSKNLYLDTLNIYGTADIGTMAYETPTAILARRLALKHRILFGSLFSEIERTPTLAQYNPHFITFEAPGGNVLLTGDNTIPLIRYAIGDRGGILSFTAAVEKIKAAGFGWKKEVARAGIARRITELPFVYVYERADLSTKVYGAIIYPEHIKTALFQPAFKKILTGKFIMATKSDVRDNEYLDIKIELKPHAAVSRPFAAKIQKAIIDVLVKQNAEYHYLYGLMPDRLKPRMFFRRYEDPAYFRPGVKQRWVEKPANKK